MQGHLLPGVCNVRVAIGERRGGGDVVDPNEAEHLASTVEAEHDGDLGQAAQECALGGRGGRGVRCRRR